MSDEFWTADRIQQLRDGVAKGIYYSKIAEMLGCTKSAAKGKADRLHLPIRCARPRRITDDLRTAIAQKLRADIAIKVIVRELGVGATYIKKMRQQMGLAPAISAPATRVVKSQVSKPLPAKKPVFTAPPPPPPSIPPKVVALFPAATCCWPIGDPKDKDFCFCDDPSMPGKPYCADHHGLAYVKHPRERDAA